MTTQGVNKGDDKSTGSSTVLREGFITSELVRSVQVSICCMTAIFISNKSYSNRHVFKSAQKCFQVMFFAPSSYLVFIEPQVHPLLVFMLLLYLSLSAFSLTVFYFNAHYTMALVTVPELSAKVQTHKIVS